MFLLCDHEHEGVAESLKQSYMASTLVDRVNITKQELNYGQSRSSV